MYTREHFRQFFLQCAPLGEGCAGVAAQRRDGHEALDTQSGQLDNLARRVREHLWPQAWAPRISLGLDELVAIAIKGKGAMPPRGGSSASDAEIKAVVTYMVNAAK